MPASSDCATLEVSVTSHIPAYTSAEEVSHKAKHLHTKRRTEDMGRSTTSTLYSAWNLDPGGIEAPWLGSQVLDHAQVLWVGTFSPCVFRFSSPKSKTSTLGLNTPAKAVSISQITGMHKSRSTQLWNETRGQTDRSSQSGTEEQVKWV